MSSKAASEALVARPETGLYRLILVVCLFFIIFLVNGSFHSFGVFLKPLAREFNATRTAVAGAISVAWIIHGCFGMTTGILLDRWGPRPLMLLGITLVCLGYGLMITSTSLWQLYLYIGLVMGIGMAPIWIVASALTAEWFSQRRGLSLGLVMAGPGAGQIVVTPLAQYLVSAFGFRTAYLIIGLVVFILAMPLVAVLKRAPREGNPGPSSPPLQKRPSEVNFTLKQALRTRSFWLLVSLWLLMPMAIHIFRVHIFPYASDKGIEETAASLIFIFLGAGIIAGRISWGSLADRFGTKRVYVVLLLLFAAVLAVTAGAAQLWAFYALAAFFGFTMGGNDPVYVKLIAEFFGPRAVGTLLGMFNFAFTLSAAAGLLIGGFIFDRTGSYSWAFVLAATVVVSAAFLSFFLTAPHPKASHVLPE